MKVIIPAAGIGKRLRPHTYSVPKALLHVAGRPIIGHILEDVIQLGPSRIVLIIGYKGELVRKYVSEKYSGLPVDFVEQRERLGIGHAIHLTRQVADSGEPILSILGDTIIKTNLGEFIKSDTNMLGVKEVEDPRRFGVCEVVDEYIVRIVEKPEVPQSNLALVGLYYIPDAARLFGALQELIDKDIRTRGEYQFTDALQIMIDKGSRFRPYKIGEWFDCGKPEALLETNRYLLERMGGTPRVEGSIIVPPAFIDPEAKVTQSIIGPNVSVAPGAVIEHSIIRDSVVDDKARIVRSVLEHSLVGAEAEVEGTFNRVDIGNSSKVVFK